MQYIFLGLLCRKRDVSTLFVQLEEGFEDAVCATLEIILSSCVK